MSEALSKGKDVSGEHRSASPGSAYRLFMRRLAGTVAVLSGGASLLCFLTARLPPLDD
ncbi:MAG: hypothetical protein Q8L44_01825 [Sulfuritalea sp.]|nr:hypothetical protein [Sulfuritalea sp.]